MASRPNRPTSTFTCPGVFLVLLSVCTQCLAVENPTASQPLPMRGHIYPVTIGAEHHIVQGRISSEAKPGALVPSNVIMEGEEDADLRVHLRVEIRESEYKRPHVYHPDIVINATDPLNPQFEHPVIKFPNSSLPYGMEFVVVHTNAFYITPERYIAVNDFGDLGGDIRIHFDVLLKDKLSETPYVSNSLPFVVEIEYPRVEANPNAALFAGVLILTILVISLVIPFGVRAKRRHKAGKPICGCGSAEDTSDCGSMGSQPEFIKNRAMSIGGKDNLAMILDHARMRNARPSEYELHQTIQNRMVRSESSLHFQPQWLDPQLSDYYHRPDFSYLEHEQQQQQQQQQQQHKPDQDHYKSNGATTKLPATAAGTNHSLAPNGKVSPGTSRQPTAPPQTPSYGLHPGNGGGFLLNGNYVSGANPPYSPGAHIHPDVINLINASRNSASTGNLSGQQQQQQQQLYPQFTTAGGPLNPLLGQNYGGSSNSINRRSSFSNTNGLAFFRAPRGTNSNRSSSNSLYHYPANFNQGIEIPMNKLGSSRGSRGEDDSPTSRDTPTGASNIVLHVPSTSDATDSPPAYAAAPAAAGSSIAISVTAAGSEPTPSTSIFAKDTEREEQSERL